MSDNSNKEDNTILYIKIVEKCKNILNDIEKFTFIKKEFLKNCLKILIFYYSSLYFVKIHYLGQKV